MILSFNDAGELISTNYWTCDDGQRAGNVWLSTPSNIWHVLAPMRHWGDGHMVMALPCTSRKEPEKPWYWLVVGQFENKSQILLFSI